MAGDQNNEESSSRQEGNEFSRTMRIDIAPEAIRRPSPRIRRLPQAERPIAVPSTDQVTENMWENRFEALFESIYDAVLITDIDGQIVNSNSRASEFLLFSREALSGQNVMSLISGAESSLLSTLLPELTNQRFVLIQAYCIRQDGTVFPSEISVSFTDRSNRRLYFFMRDVTVRKQKEDRLVEQYNAIQHAGSGIAMADLEGVLTDANPAAAKMWGYEHPSDLVGKNVMSLWIDANAVDAKAMVDAVMSGQGTWTGDLAARQQDGTVFHANVLIGRNEDSEGALTGLVFSFVDISDRVRAMNRLRELDETKSQFVAEASHELRTPLAIINEFVSLVRDEVTGPINAQQKECLESVLKNCTRLTDLINTMLDLARIEAGKVKLERQRTGIASILTECHKNFLPSCKSKKQDLSLTVSEEFPDVYCDVASIHKVLTNLMGNAVKFTPQGGKIHIGCQSEGQYLRISVEDNGRGISPDVQKSIFDAFYQVEREAGPGAKGTGLGLAIVKKLIELNGGIVSVDSAPRRGSCFSFTLPLYTQDAPARARVLVVDDDRMIIEMITRSLEMSDLNLEMKSTLTGMEALFIAGNYDPDLVILDVKLGDVEGAKILGMLKQREGGGGNDSMKVLAISGDDNLLRDLMSKGADDCLGKPFKPDALVEKVKTLIGSGLQDSG